MTRREELEEKVKTYMGKQYTDECVKQLVEFVAQVERECWERTVKEVERRQGLILPPGHSFDFHSGWGNACYDLRKWCRDQLKEVEG